MQIIDRDVLDGLTKMADELGIEVTNAASMAAFVQELQGYTIGDVTTLACYLLAASMAAASAESDAD